MVFVVITLLGVSFVGARYARLDRLFFDDTYTVVAHFTDSGGIFAGGEVTYRGVRVGQVDKLELTDDGVDVLLSIQKDYDSIPPRRWPSSATAPPWVSSTSSCSRRTTRSPTSPTTRRSRTRTPGRRSPRRPC